MADGQGGFGSSGMGLHQLLTGISSALGSGAAPQMTPSQLQAIQQQFARQNPAQYGFGQHQGIAGQPAGQFGFGGSPNAMQYGFQGGPQPMSQAFGGASAPTGIAGQAGQKSGATPMQAQHGGPTPNPMMKRPVAPGVLGGRGAAMG